MSRTGAVSAARNARGARRATAATISTSINGDAEIELTRHT